MIRIVSSMLLLAASLAAAAPPAGSAADLFERLQRMREEAREMARAGPADGLRRAARHLESACAILALPAVRELATGSPRLYSRNYDVRLELAATYARLGDNDKALGTLEEALTYAWIPSAGAALREEPVFAPLRDAPRFQALIARSELPNRVWRSAAIASPYKDRLSLEERIAGLSLYWAEARQHFAWFENVPRLDWDAVYLEFLPKVMAAETTYEYYRVMMQLAPRLHDGHTSIYPPRELAGRLLGRPPLRTAKVEGRVIVTEVSSASLAKRVAVGDEVVAIDGTPVMAYARDRVQPIASASTPQDLDVRIYGYLLLAGDEAQAVTMRLRGADGSERDERIERRGYDDLVQRPLFQFRMLDGGIAYLALDHFESDAGVKAFEAALPQILQARGLVLDLRRNGGGSTTFGLEILASLTRKPIEGSVGRLRLDFGARREGMVRWVPEVDDDGPYRPARERFFEGPVAVLVGPQTYSAAEDFLVSFDLLRRGPIVGEATGGSTGQPMFVALPGGGRGRICAKRDSYPDGREFVGRGIAPTIDVRPTVDDIRAGRDPVLARAVAALRP